MCCLQCVIVSLTCLYIGSGDGNCGYRAFMVGMITAAFNSPKTRALLVQTFPKVLHSISRWGFMDGGRRVKIQEGAAQLKVCSMARSEPHSSSAVHILHTLSNPC